MFRKRSHDAECTLPKCCWKRASARACAMHPRPVGGVLPVPLSAMSEPALCEKGERGSIC